MKKNTENTMSHFYFNEESDYSEENAGADSKLAKLVVMTNFFFNNQQLKITICVKEITPSFLSNS